MLFKGFSIFNSGGCFGQPSGTIEAFPKKHFVNLFEN